MTHPKANKSIKPRMFLKQPSPPLAQLLNRILLTSRLKDRKKTEGGTQLGFMHEENDGDKSQGFEKLSELLVSQLRTV